MLRHKRKNILSLTILLMAWMAPVMLQAASVTLAWQANTEDDLAGYKIYYGTDALNPDRHVTIESTAATQQEITGLTEGMTYYFRMTAFDSNRSESAFSQVINCVIADETGPVLSSVNAEQADLVVVVFNEAVDQATAEITANYDISDGIAVNSATLQPDGKTVHLSTSSHSEQSYQITINNIRDISSNLIDANTTGGYTWSNVDLDPPELVSFTRISDNTLKLEFSEPVNQTTAKNSSNYDISPALNINDIDLNFDFTVVYLFTDEHQYNVDYTISITGITDVAQNTIPTNTSASYSFTSTDQDAPDLIAARLNATADTLEVEFSEALLSATATDLTHYAISPSIAISGAVMKPGSNDKVLLATQVHAGGSYQLTVNGVCDLSNNAIASEILSYQRSLDETAPTIVSHDLNRDDLIILTFSEDMDKTSTETVSNYTISPSVPIESVTMINTTTVWILTTQAHQPDDYTLTVENVTDASVNANPIAVGTSVSYTFERPDQEGPQIVGATLHGSDMVELVFNEGVDRVTAENISNYNISPSVAVTRALLVGQEQKHVYVYTDPHQPGENYTIDVIRVKDLADVPNVIAQGSQASYDYPLTDTTPPSLVAVNTFGNQFLELIFSEALDQTSAETVANYTIDPSVSVTRATLDVSGQKVFLNTDIHAPNQSYIITVENVTDRAATPNAIGTENMKQYDSESSDNTPPTFRWATAHSKSLVELVFSEPLNATTALDAANYSINRNVTVTSIQLDHTGMGVFLTTSAHNRGDYEVTVSNIQDVSGNTMPVDITRDYTYTPEDTLAPRLAAAEAINAHAVQLTFNEPLDETTATSVNTYRIISVDDDTITIQEARLDLNMTGVTLHTETQEPAEYTVTVNGLKDASGNDSNILVNGTRNYLYNVEDFTAPVLVSAELDDNSDKKLLVTFSEDLESISAQTLGNYRINNNIDVTDVLAHSGNQVLLETDIHTPGTYTLTVSNLKDASPQRNVIEQYSQVTYVYNPEDTLAPALIHAEAPTNQNVYLTFSEAIDDDEANNIANYTITPDIQIRRATLHADGKTVGLMTDAHQPDTYTITVQNIQDRAFNPNVIGENNTQVYTYTPPDTIAPHLGGVMMYNSPQMVKLLFDEPLERASAENLANYWITPDLQISGATLNSSSTMVTLETAPHSADVNYTIFVTGVRDRSAQRNTMTDTASVPYTYEPEDRDPPVLESVKITDLNRLELIFSEDMDQASAQNRDNYIFDPATVEVLDASISTQTAKKVILETTDHVPFLPYKISVQNLKDKATPPNTIQPNQGLPYSYNMSESNADVTAPQVARVDVISSTKMEVVFTEALDKESAENEDNYIISGDVVIKKATLDTSLHKVILATNEQEKGKSYSLQVRNLKDCSPNSNMVQSGSAVKYLLSEGISLSKLSRSEYDWSGFQVGDKAYVDRNYTVSEIPQYLEGVVRILTVNDDKATDTDVLFTFDMNGDGTIYIAHDKRIAELPDWMSSWKVTGDQVINSRGDIFNIYSKQFQAGRVSLGGNSGTTDDNMYMVFIEPNYASRSVLTSLSKSSYNSANLAVGDAYYVDRDYTLASIPESLEGMLWIQTANDDKQATEEEFLTFSLNRKSNIYVAFDNRSENVPDWLDDFEAVDETIVDSRGMVFDLYVKTYEIGEVRLGGNHGTAEDNMYLVLVEPLEGANPGEDEAIPGYFALHQNYPNPFNPETTIPYTIERPGEIKLTVFNVLGQLVMEFNLTQEEMEVGSHSVTWDGRNMQGMLVASGVYFCRIQQGQFAETRRMLLLR